MEPGSRRLAGWAFAGMAVALAVVVMVETLRGDNA